MKVLMINGSPHAEGNTWAALHEMEKILNAEGIETEIVQVGDKAIRGCLCCYKCKEGLGRCVIDSDIVNETVARLKDADGLVLGSPVYYAGVNGTMKAFLDRLFYSARNDYSLKVGAAIAIARRGGIETTLDAMNKYLFYHGFAIAGSQYWSGAYGHKPGEDLQDLEGMQIMRTLAHNMVFLLHAVSDAKEKYGKPEREARQSMNFIR